MSGEYRVKVSVSNNLILKKIEAMGYPSQAAFARDWGISKERLNSLIGMRVSPIGGGGSLSRLAQELCLALDALPQELWTDKQLWRKVVSNVGTVEVDECDLDRILDNDAVKQLMGSLTTKEKEVIRLRHEEEWSLEETAKSFRLSQERIRQIEIKACDKMRRKRRGLGDSFQ